MFLSLCKNVEHDWQPQEPELRDRDYIMSDLNRWIIVSMTKLTILTHSFTPPPSLSNEQTKGLHHVWSEQVNNHLPDQIHYHHKFTLLLLISFSRKTLSDNIVFWTDTSRSFGQKLNSLCLGRPGISILCFYQICISTLDINSSNFGKLARRFSNYNRYIHYILADE